ncbi:peptidase M28, partial [Candidatus Zixiibacteriota bacterium]
LRLGGGGPDIGPLAAHGVPLLGVWASTELYFDYHHSEEDVVENVVPSLLADQTAAMAVMAYILADMETPLSRISPEQ